MRTDKQQRLLQTAASATFQVIAERRQARDNLPRLLASAFVRR
jgi:hypothetical protein